jgi:DNA primase
VPIFSESFIERVRSASDIVDVIGSYLPLKRAGTNFVALCPFHKEKSPSFNVSPGRQIFHCFGCHAGGNVFKFVQQYENVSFPEAIERLAQRAQIPLEHDQNPGAARVRGLKDQLLRLHEAICVRWQQCLATEAGGQVARDYLEKRGVSAEAIREFRIGAAPESWDDTVNWAKAKGFESELCEQAGLIIRKEDTGRCYDRFRGRLMFPICDEQGRVIAFSGRVLSGDEKTAKYVNSPETPIFTKGKVLYAFDKAKRPILEAGHAIICEGQLDTIACHVAGVRNVVAPQGTALTADHARILKRYVGEVVLCFDGDKAGRAASVRSLDECLPVGLAVKVASIPPPDDPDSYLRQHGADAFRAILAKAQGFFDFYLSQLTMENDLTSDRGRLVVLRSMAEKVNRTGNAVLVDTYAQRTATRLGVTAEAVRAEFKKVKPPPVREYRMESRGPARPVASTTGTVTASPTESGPSNGGVIDSPEAALEAAADAEAEASAMVPPQVDPSLEQVEPPRPGRPEFWLLKFLLLADGEALAWASSHLDCNWISHGTVRRIAEARMAQAGSEQPNDLEPLLTELADDRFAVQWVTEAASESREVPDLPRQLQEATVRLRDLWIDRQIALLTGQLTEPGISVEQLSAVERQKQELRAWKKLPLTELGGF